MEEHDAALGSVRLRWAGAWGAACAELAEHLVYLEGAAVAGTRGPPLEFSRGESVSVLHGCEWLPARVLVHNVQAWSVRVGYGEGRKELVEEGRVCRPLAMEAPLIQPGLEGYTVTPGDAGWREEALRIFRRAGVVVIRGGLPADACTRLHDACKRAESEVRNSHHARQPGP